MSKEELKELNVTVNKSCQEIPSQTLDDSDKNVANNGINSGNYLQGDEEEIIENNSDENNAGKTAQFAGKKSQTVALIPAATVNPIDLETRVVNNLRSMMNSGKLGSLKDAKFH